MAARECPAPTNKPNKKTKMKNLLLAAASLSLFCGVATPNAAQARDIASRAEYDRVTKNALDDIERKQIQPTVYNWGGGDVDYEYRGDGYVLDQKFRPGSFSFICLNDTDVNQTCWGENGTMWKRHWGPVPGGGGPYNWLYDGPDPGQVVFLRKRWPGEAAPDLFK
jgi:hypothetical protein